MHSDRELAIQICKKLISRLKSSVPVVRVYAYGSRVRGDCEPDSDLDILVELKSITTADKGKVYDIAWEIGFEADIVISVVIVSAEEFENGLLSGSLFARTVRREGIQFAA